MASRLTNLKVHEVSFVPAGANKGAKLLFFKSGGTDVALTIDEIIGKIVAAWDGVATIEAKDAIAKVAKGTPTDADVAEIAAGVGDALAYLKRDFTADQRQAAADSGAAMPGGGYPIENKADLVNAMRAIGRAKDPEKTKAHIRSRAKALGLTSELTDAFKVGKFGAAVAKALAAIGIGKDGEARDFDEVHDAIEAGEFASGMLSEIDEAVQALRTSVCEIMTDDATSDKGAAINQTFDQFKTHIQGVVPEWMEKAVDKAKTSAEALAKSGGDAGQPGAVTMDNAGIIKALGLDPKATEEQIGKALTDAVTDAAFGKAVDGMSAKHTAFMNHPDATMPTGGKKAFAAMAPGERDKHMSSNPINDDPDDTEKALKGLPESVRKGILADRERIAKLENDATLTQAIAKASTLPFIAKKDDLAGIIVDLAKAGTPISDKVLGVLQTANDKLAKFLGTEHGSGQGGGATSGNAYEQINKLATELVGKSAGVRLTIEKARAQVRKAHPELAKQEEQEAQERRAASTRRAA